MSGDNFSDGFLETRSVLGDLTNRPVKRRFSATKDRLVLKSGDVCGENVLSEDGDSCFMKQVCLGVENLVKERCKTKFGVDSSNGKELSPMKDGQGSDSSATNSKIGLSEENTVSDISIRPNETVEKLSNLLDGNVNVISSGKMAQSVVEVGEASRDSCASSGSIPTSSCPNKRESDEKRKFDSNVALGNLVGHDLSGHVSAGDQNEHGVGRLAGGKHGSVEWLRLPKSHGSTSFELERCTALTGECNANMNAGADLLKACSCSFCQKAAYIWSDLHYQDIKGRIAALRKSQKEASILVNRYGRGQQTETQNQGNISGSSKLESDLSVQWRSLFHHMENIIAHESSQLQDSFVTLRDLREDCKTDLERPMD